MIVSIVDPLTSLSVADVAVIIVEPGDVPVARPSALTVAMMVSLKDHVTSPGSRSLIEPSSWKPVAENCSIVPISISGSAGVMSIDVKFRTRDKAIKGDNSI